MMPGRQGFSGSNWRDAGKRKNPSHETSTFFFCVVSAAAVVAHANAVASCPLKPAQRSLLWGTIGAGVVTGGFVDLAKITRPWQEEMLGRLAGAMAIIAGCGTLTLLVIFLRGIAAETRRYR